MGAPCEHRCVTVTGGRRELRGVGGSLEAYCVANGMFFVPVCLFLSLSLSLALFSLSPSLSLSVSLSLPLSHLPNYALIQHSQSVLRLPAHAPSIPPDP